MTVALNPSLTHRYYTWAAWKAAYAARSGRCQHDGDGATYIIWFYDGPEIHITEIWQGTAPTGVDQGANDADKEDFEKNYKDNSNKTLEPTASDGRKRTIAEKAEDSSVTIYSHDWTDKTTWRETAVRVVDEIATDDGSHTVYSLAHEYIIDNYHGKMTTEDYLKDAGGHSYRVIVKVDGATRTEQDPHYGSGGDYTIDYAVGKITFLSALQANSAVTVTYHYATSSLLTVKPAAGKVLTLAVVECQFATDIIMTDTAVFQPYGYVVAFAPYLAQSNGGPYPDQMLIPLGSPVKYKSMKDFQNDAWKSYPAYPAMGGTGWRGAPESLVMDWDYLKAKPLLSSKGMEIRITLEHDTPFDGSYATATFYCGTESE